MHRKVCHRFCFPSPESASLPQNTFPFFVGTLAFITELHLCFIFGVFTFLFVSMILTCLSILTIKHALTSIVCLDSKYTFVLFTDFNESTTGTS